MPLGLSPRILDDPREAVRFDGFASVMGLKSDAETCLLDRIRDKPNVTIVTGKPVLTLLGDERAPERIVGVISEDGLTHRADVVLLAAGALSSPRLLQGYLATAGLAGSLPSASSVGRNYKSHLLTAVVGWSPSRKHDRLRKTVVMTHDRFPAFERAAARRDGRHDRRDRIAGLRTALDRQFDWRSRLRLLPADGRRLASRQSRSSPP